jgi:hypothetical protein
MVGTKNSFKEQKEVKPAISENWKQLFKLDPQLYQPEATRYFDKDEFRIEINYKAEEN